MERWSSKKTHLIRTNCQFFLFYLFFFIDVYPTFTYICCIILKEETAASQKRRATRRYHRILACHFLLLIPLYLFHVHYVSRRFFRSLNKSLLFKDTGCTCIQSNDRVCLHSIGIRFWLIYYISRDDLAYLDRNVKYMLHKCDYEPR